jgi:hypothetical protein
LHVGNYTLSDLLGRGGTSEVYAAQHTFLGDTVAVKLLRRSLAEDERVREAFVAEAARTREIQHPNVVRVLDFGHDATQGCYLVMERIDGESLAARLRRLERLDEPALRELAAAIADGMQAAHACGIVHRDLKPGNVMLRGDTPTIVDFGIAKSLGNTSAVVTERRVGTVAYMAPEQLVDGLITPAVDIWALGVIMYEAATGRAPFANFTDGRLPQLFESPPRARSLAPISPALDQLIARCLERDPGKRPASMAEVARALRADAAHAPDGDRITEDVAAPGALHADAILATRIETALPEGVVEARRRTRWFLIAGTAAAAVVVGVVAFVLLRDETVTPRAVPTDAAPMVESHAPAVVPMPSPQPAPVQASTKPPPPDHKRARPKKLENKSENEKKGGGEKKTEKTTSQGEGLD